MRLRNCVIAVSFLAAMAIFMTAGCGNNNSPSLRPEEAMEIAMDAYIYGYPLVTFDTVRQQQTNVAAPDPEHAPMGQVIKMRSYPAVDNHCCAAPNADTLVHRGLARRFEGAVGLQHSRHGRPLLHHADAGRVLGSLQGRESSDNGKQGADLRHHRARLVRHAASGT